MTRAQIQALIDAQVALGGGTVTPTTHETHALDGPIQLADNITLQLDINDTLSKSAGPAVEWHNAGGYCRNQSLVGGKILTTTGPGIAFSSASTDESDMLSIIGTTFDTGGVCIEMRKAVDKMSYNPRFERLIFDRCNGMVLAGPLHNFLIDGWHFVNVTRVGAVVNPAVIYVHDIPGLLGGSGSIVNSHLQPNLMGCPILRTRGCDIDWSNNHNEQEDDGYHFIFNSSRVLADHIYYTSVDQKIKLEAGSELTFLRKLEHQDGAGGQAAVTSCYESDGDPDNLLVFRNQTWFGPAGAGAIMGGDDQTVYYGGASAVSFWARDENGDVWDGAAYVDPVDGGVATYRIADVPLGGGLYGFGSVPTGAVLMELRKDAATVALSLRYGFVKIGLTDEEKLDVADAILNAQQTDYDDAGTVGESIGVGGSGGGASNVHITQRGVHVNEG